MGTTATSRTIAIATSIGIVRCLQSQTWQLFLNNLDQNFMNFFWEIGWFIDFMLNFILFLCLADSLISCWISPSIKSDTWSSRPFIVVSFSSNETFSCFNLRLSSGINFARISLHCFYWSGDVLSFLASQLHYKHNFQSLWHVMKITMFCFSSYGGKTWQVSTDSFIEEHNKAFSKVKMQND